MEFFKKEKRTALEAIEYAQWIAHAPMVFQASRVLRDSGILKVIQDSKKAGLTLEEVVEKVKLPHYGVRVLLESGLGIGLVLFNDGKYTITKTGLFILNDNMTRVNMDFVQDVCYKGLYNLEDSIKNEKPEGLKVFGNWKTVYEALSQLPDFVQRSWFGFDHYYSDDAFPLVLPLVFKNKPKKLLDIGGNTGKWSMACAKFDKDVHLTIVDLPGQVNMAKANIEKQGLADRISFYETNILDENNKLPKGYDAIWMSQFLDCFSEKEIVSILNRCYEAINDDGYVFILEPFWDRQRFEAAAFSLQQTSLYFTTIANGNSQMYHSEVFLTCVRAAGFEVVEQIDQIGVSQSLLKCRKKK
ncbi:MAG: methyltransferase domain-containing protein [Bacteroidetes bacterium]|nr:methyltransferase domain-containing protein [Bacteroidota bacterium]